MPHLIFAPRAQRGLERCIDFLAEVNPPVVDRAAAAIGLRLDQLTRSPAIGRPYRPNPALRELVIAFGGAGYVALYRHDADQDAVIVLAFRHQREASFE
jgi:plasmid stabilization system protein ParE